MIRLYHSIRRYLRNLKVFHKLLTSHSPFDYQGILVGMKCAVDDMEKMQASEEYLVSVNRDKYCKRMRIFSNSLGRLIEDEYCLDQYEIHLKNTKGLYRIDLNKYYDLPSVKVRYKLEDSQKKLDLEIVSKYINKHLFSWWS